MLLVVGLVFLCLRPRQTLKLWPMVLPALVVIHLAIPHTLGIIKDSFFPQGGVAALVVEQEGFQGSRRSGGRIDDLGPTLSEVSAQPLLGLGYGTRIIEGPKANARILDDQWLGTLLETGVIGVAAWIWVFVVFVRRMSRAGLDGKDDPDGGWLFVALTASIASFAVGMLLFDALGFVQVTFLTFILMAFGCILLRLRAEVSPARQLKSV
jgi:O-antigen ligase